MFRITSKISRKLFNTNTRSYIIKQNDWNSYCLELSKPYTQIDQYNMNSTSVRINNAVLDTLTTQTREIKDLKLELFELNCKIQKLIETQKTQTRVEAQKLLCDKICSTNTHFNNP